MPESNTAVKKTTFAEQAARASVYAPIIAFGISSFILTLGSHPRIAEEVTDARNRYDSIGNLVLSGASALLVIIGLVCSIIGLLGVKKHGRKGILGRSIAGLIINGFLIVLAIILIRLLVSISHRMEERAEAERRGRQEFEASYRDYPGWCGVLETREAIIAVVSFDNRSPIAKNLNGYLKTEVSMNLVNMVNRSTDQPVAIDLAKAEIELKDGTKKAFLPFTEVLKSAREDKAQFLEKNLGPFSGPFVIPPQSTSPNYFLFTLQGFPWDNVKAVIIHVSGRRVIVEGKMLSPEEKRERKIASAEVYLRNVTRRER